MCKFVDILCGQYLAVLILIVKTPKNPKPIK